MTTTDRLQGVRTTQAIKTPVVVATTANITLSGTQTIDGVAVVAGDRVLVKDQTDTTQNGIYNCAAGAWARALDFNSTQEIAEGTTIFVARGTVNAARVYAISTPSPAIGSAMSFVQVAVLGDGALFAMNNLSDLDDPAVALTNLGLTATAVELNHVEGATDSIQNQLDGKAALTGQSTILTSSGTSKDQVIPAGVSQISIGFTFVSLSGTDDILVQIGTGGTPQTSSYASACSVITSTVTTTGNTNGFRIEVGGAGKLMHGDMTLRLIDPTANAWSAVWSLRTDNGEIATGGGSVFLSGSLDIFRILTSGTDTFDNGRIGLLWSY